MKLTHSLGVKITAIFLFALLAFFTVCGAGLFIIMTAAGYYEQGAAEMNLPLYSMRNSMLPLTIIGFLAGVALYLFLLCAAGHRTGREEVTRNLQDKIPFDLYLAVAICLGIAFGSLIEILLWMMPAVEADSLSYERYSSYLWECFALLICAVAIILIVLACSMTIATRIKTRTLIRNTITYHALRLTWRLLCWFGRGIRKIFRNISILWKLVLAFGAYMLANVLLFYNMEYRGDVAAVWLLLNAVVLVMLCFVALQLRELRKGAHCLAEGDMAHHINTNGMYWGLKTHGEDLNRISEGMAHAVEERMKSERMKTELITNVSHDIKTPLTSIINYVDLLQKEGVTGEDAREYLAVLNRQANKLKKLTEDILEASKASTGNIAVALVRTDAVELLAQSLAEYGERFAAANLTAVSQVPAQPMHILADGRLLWRVFDNLLSNATKYSQPGTRVYAAIAQEGEDVVISLKNVSRDPLNISEEELMERFVRGDSARTSEGSGLGLSIARSLAELQGGRFAISIDGDLFKAELRFAAAAAEAETIEAVE